MMKFLQQKLLMVLVCTGVVSATTAGLTAQGKVRSRDTGSEMQSGIQGQSSRVEIRGRVSDETGESLPGALVKIKGTSLQTSTDEKGNFTLQAPGTGAVLVISFLGFETMELAAREGVNNIVLRMRNLF